MAALRLECSFTADLRGYVDRIRTWQVWSLREPLRSYIIGITAGAVIAQSVAVVNTRFHWKPVVIFMALVACGIITIESTRTIKEVHGSLVRDLQPVWYLAIAIILLPAFALVAPIPLLAYKLLRQPGLVFYRRVFSNATISLAYGGASWLFHVTPQSIAGPLPQSGVHVLTWTAMVAVCGVTAWVVNAFSVVLAIRLSDSGARLRDLITNREAAASDFIELSLSVSLALVVSINPILMALALPSIVLYRRYYMQAQLVAQVRMDAKTGFLNTASWRREAEVEVLRALRNEYALTLIMVDIDHFSSVNETAGRAAGDQVLRGIANTLRENLQGSGIVGRFGGEEFAILLPHAGEADARRIAERLRDHIAGEPIAIEDGSHAGFVFRLTVSIGIAVLDHSRRALAELIGAADEALNEAKSTGRNRVCVVPGAVVQDN
jgi:diguanylate cyclase (GGDEF)-like protein